MLHSLTRAMVEFDHGDAKRIQHFIKVHAFARLIGLEENLDEETQLTLEAAALVHDIGIHPCEEKYGRCDGPLQEKEGPAYAREMLDSLGFPDWVTDRVAYLVGHHHTYEGIDGLDYQILVESDFLVNLYEDDMPKSAAQTAWENVFRTKTGKALCRTMFDL